MIQCLFLILAVVAKADDKAPSMGFFSAEDRRYIHDIEANSDLRLVNTENQSGETFFIFRDSTQTVQEATGHLKELRNSILTSPKRNLIVVTDMEPDDRMALNFLIGKMKPRLKFIGTTVMNARRKASLVENMMESLGVSGSPHYVPKQSYLNSNHVPVYVGSGGTADQYPDISSSRVSSSTFSDRANPT